MKRFSVLAVLAAALILGLSMVRSAHADPMFGFPVSYRVTSDLNAVGTLTQCNAPPQLGGITPTINIAGTFVGGVDVYTSADGKFDDAVKYGSEITAPTVTPMPLALPSGTSAVRAQNRAYTSGDIFTSLDCKGGYLVFFPEPAPTPTATP